jgi:TM2 domain-containing membrane protein YozV
MKMRIIFSVLTLLLTVNLSYASFPTVRNVATTNQTISTETISENMDEVVAPVAASSGKSQIAAALLAWTVGVIGIHRFYLGYTWQGVVQILTLGGLGIWTLIDLIRIITGDLKPKGGRYSKTF